MGEVEDLSSQRPDEEHESSAPGEEGSEPGDAVPGQAYAVRQAVVMLKTPEPGKRNLERWLGQICDGLKADSRVGDLRRPRYRAHQARVDQMFPATQSATDDALLTGQDTFFAYTFSDPVIFSVTVAPENQKEFRGEREFPAGKYWVSWNGTCLAVLWEQQSDRLVSLAAGRIVVDLLRDVARAAHLDVYVQSCNPGCQNLFTHTDALIVESGSKHFSHARLKCIHREALLDPEGELRRWYKTISYPFGLFAIFKNHARRIRDIEATAGVRLTSLLALQQRRAAVTNRANIWSRLKGRWQLRGSRREAERYMADVWLASAGIENMRRSWDEERRRFKNSIVDDVQALFAKDSSDDELAVDSIDLSLTRAALDHSSSRMDTQTMVLVTGLAGAAGLVGAVAGALLGAAVAG